MKLGFAAVLHASTHCSVAAMRLEVRNWCIAAKAVRLELTRWFNGIILETNSHYMNL
jgi:hypothetical protein